MCACYVASVICNPMDCRPPGSSVHGILQNTAVGFHALSRDLPNPGVEPGSPALQVDSLSLSRQGSLIYLCITEI